MDLQKINIILAICTLYYVVPFQASPLDDPDVGLNTVQMLENHGYPYQNHIITTEDGYILTYHRVPHGKKHKGTVKKPAVLLMHGVSASAADYVNMGPNRSLAYILADHGYDVWLANARGTLGSRNHTKLDVVKDAEQFFDFSWHEIGYYDLPAAIDHILKTTGHRDLFYVGHSQGCTSFLVLTSTRPEYNKKFKLASLMAPAAFMDNHSNRLSKGVSSLLDQLLVLKRVLNLHELPFVDELHRIGVIFCSRPEFFPICAIVFFMFEGADPPQFDQNKIAVLLTNTPTHFSFNQMIHYGQLIRNGGFSHYDYGKRKNLKIYATTKPPIYNLSKVSAPVAIYYSKNDGLVNLKDAKNLIGKLPNVVHSYLVPYDLFNHADFTYAKDVVKLLYIELLKDMKRHQN